MLDICNTCLSVERRLIPLSTLNHVFLSVNWSDLQLDMQGGICWECLATLERAQRFRSQAARAQATLSLYQCVEKPTACESLSRLICVSRIGFDECILNEVNEVKLERQEDSFDFDADLKFHAKAKIEKCEDSDHQQDDNIELDTSPKPKAKHKRKKKIQKTEKNKIKKEMKVSKDEERFIINIMSLDEFYKKREEDQNGARYKSCPYKCTTCITGYFNEEKYNTHIRIKHSEDIGPYTCSICCVRFKRAEALHHHEECHLREYQCRECPYRHHRLSAMLIHDSDQHRLDKFDCKLCGKGFVKMRQLRYHFEKTHKDRPTCDECGKTYVTMYNLKKHIMMAHEARPLAQCGECGGRFRNLRAHARTHARAAPDACAYCAECGTQFRAPHIYRRHLVAHKRHRSRAALRYACTHCDARFTNNTSLSRHISSRHTKEYPFTCDACGKGFLRKDRLKNHIQEKHEGIPRPKDKVCTYCGKGFKDTQVLLNHTRTHTGEKPFRCALCPWTFAQRTALVAHARAIHPHAHTSTSAPASSSLPAA